MTLLLLGLVCGLVWIGVSVVVLACVMLSSEISQREETQGTRPKWAGVKGRWE